MGDNQEDENKLKLLKNVFSFIEIDGMGKSRVWKEALILDWLMRLFSNTLPIS